MKLRPTFGPNILELTRWAPRRGEALTFSDREQAARLLNRLRQDVGAIEVFRRALVDSGDLGTHRLTDAQIVTLLADRLWTGGLKLVESTPERRRPGPGGGGGGEKQKGSEDAEETRPSRPRAPRPSQDDAAPALIDATPAPVPVEPVATPLAEEPIDLELAYRVESTSLRFANESSLLVPLPSDGEVAGTDVPPVMALLTAIRFMTDRRGYGLAVVGHTSASGAHSVNDPLSERRAQGVTYFLDDRRDDWVALADAHGRVRDYQALLAYLTAYHHWDCDPGVVDGLTGPNTHDALERFQARYNPAYGASIGVDGKVGPQTWGALFDVMQDEWLVGLEINDLAIADVKAYVDDAAPSAGAGERALGHEKLPTATSSEESRFVDLLLVPTAGEADLSGAGPIAGLYDRFEIEPIPIDVDRPPSDPPHDDQYQVWVRAFDHFAERRLGDCEYQLTGLGAISNVVRDGVTNAEGELREQELACGDYHLEISGGAATVATRWQFESRDASGDSLAGHEAWPDAVRVHGASGGQKVDPHHEPGVLVSEEERQTHDWIWSPEDIAGDLEAVECNCEVEHEDIEDTEESED